MAPASGIIAKFEQAASSIPRKNLMPINRAAFDADRVLLLNKASSLGSYSRYLEQARAAKGQRGGVSQVFERAVQGEARRALDDMEAFGGAALRMMQQINQTALWSQTLERVVVGLRATGPLSAKQIWDELQAHEPYRALMRQYGFTDEMAAATTKTLLASDARLVLRSGKPAVEAHLAGQDQPRLLSLGRPPTLPTTVTELLRRSRFEQIVAAFANREFFLEVISSGSGFDYALGDLVAIGAVASRERLAEHVRKLEDTGLAIYSGRDPATILVTLFVIGIVLVGLAGVFETLCGPEIVDDTGEPVGDRNETACSIATVLIILAIIVLGLVALGLLLAGGGWVIAGVLMGFYIYGLSLAFDVMDRAFTFEGTG